MGVPWPPSVGFVSTGILADATSFPAVADSLCFLIPLTNNMYKKWISINIKAVLLNGPLAHAVYSGMFFFPSPTREILLITLLALSHSSSEVLLDFSLLHSLRKNCGLFIELSLYTVWQLSHLELGLLYTATSGLPLLPSFLRVGLIPSIGHIVVAFNKDLLS